MRSLETPRYDRSVATRDSSAARASDSGPVDTALPITYNDVTIFVAATQFLRHPSLYYAKRLQSTFESRRQLRITHRYLRFYSVKLKFN